MSVAVSDVTPCWRYGKVVFTGDAVFTSNEARSSGDEPAGYGGAVAVGPEGSLEFQGALEFTDNKAQSGGSGGAIANFGSLVFRRKNYFWFNTAAGTSCHLRTPVLLHLRVKAELDYVIVATRAHHTLYSYSSEVHALVVPDNTLCRAVLKLDSAVRIRKKKNYLK